MQILSFDVGGTAIKYVICNENGQSLSTVQTIPTQVSQNSNDILNQLVKITLQMKKKYPLNGVAIATAGVVNQLGEIIYSGYTIPGYMGTKLKHCIEEQCQLPCEVLNDANAACLGEFWKGQYSLKDTMLYITVGTGIGGSVLIDGTLMLGKTFTAGEIGYMPVNGQHFQDIASTTALLKMCEETLGEKLTGREFFERLTKESGVYTTILNTFIDYLTDGLLICIYLLNPDVIVLGGGIMEQSIMLSKIRSKLASKIIHQHFLKTRIETATLGNKAGVIGAVYYFIQQRMDK